MTSRDNAEAAVGGVGALEVMHKECEGKTLHVSMPGRGVVGLQIDENPAAKKYVGGEDLARDGHATRVQITLYERQRMADVGKTALDRMGARIAAAATPAGAAGGGKGGFQTFVVGRGVEAGHEDVSIFVVALELRRRERGLGFH
ncbi:MAG: hypothetical protein AMXMBFR7_45030 [Planctomycetota bacterium]